MNASDSVKWKVAIIIAGFLLAGLLAALWFDMHRSARAIVRCGIFAPVLLNSGLLAANVRTNHEDRDLTLASLDILADRQSDIVRHQAKDLLTSDEPYLWLNGAIYLGRIRDQDAVPYLIKSLRHQAFRNVNSRRNLLNDLTQVDFSTFEAWTNWWGSRPLPQGFDWNNRLGNSHQNERH